MKEQNQKRLKSADSYTKTPEDIKILELYSDGNTPTMIAKQLGINSLTVSAKISALLNQHYRVLGQNAIQIDVEQSGKRIIACIGERGFTLQEIQYFLNLESVQAIYRWKRRNLPSLSNLYALSDLLEIPIDNFLVALPQKTN